MVELWYAVLVLMVGLFVILDGWDIGAGVLHLVIGKNDADRRTVISAIGPFWLWHESWLIAAGGVLVLAFPAVMGTAFSGFYLALMMVLWALIGRGMAIELAGHIKDRLWRAFWDIAFALSSALLAILLGAAFGNILRGVPLSPEGRFSLPLFTHFGVRGAVGILDWYTVSVAAFTLVCLAAHGASYLALRTDGKVNQEANRQAGRLWLATVVSLPVLTVMTWYVRRELFAGIASRPLAWAFVAVLVGGIWAVATGVWTREERRTFLGGCAIILGLLGSAAVGVFPVMLKSTIATEHSITAFEGGTAEGSLRIGLVWWPVAFVMAIGYILFIALHFGGKISGTPALLEYGTHSGPLPDEQSEIGKSSDEENIQTDSATL